MDSSKVALNTLIADMPDEVYHSMSGSFSSSQLKDALDDIEVFHKKYITKEIPRLDIPAFAVGSYFHCAILEPHKLEETCVVWGKTRRGKDWEDFQAANKNKAIITASESAKADLIVNAVKKSEMAMSLLENGDAEVSAFLEVYVYGNEIIIQKGKDKFQTLVKTGWATTLPKIGKAAMKDGIKLLLKVRADFLAEDFILDLKSTTGGVSDNYSLSKKVTSYKYDLSAALYLDIFTAVTGRNYNKFIWTWACKDTGSCKNTIASPDQVCVGRAKWKKAVLNLANAIRNKWEFKEELVVLDSPRYEKEEWLSETKQIEDEL